MSMMEGETCNHCDGDLGAVDERVLAMICPHCHKATGVCANCHWWTGACFGGANCPYNQLPNETNNENKEE